jgi:hypothetical protein
MRPQSQQRGDAGRVVGSAPEPAERKDRAEDDDSLEAYGPEHPFHDFGLVRFDFGFKAQFGLSQVRTRFLRLGAGPYPRKLRSLPMASPLCMASKTRHTTPRRITQDVA